MTTHAPQSDFLWYDLMVNDLDSAIRFYTGVVGWEVRDSGMDGMRYMLFGKNGVDVGGMMSWRSMGMGQPGKWVGHISTPEVDAETAAVVSDGGQQFRPPTDIPGIGRFSIVADPQGAEFMLFQPSGAQSPTPLKPQDVGAVGWRELVATDWEKAWDFYSKHYGWTKDIAVNMGPMGIYQTFSAAKGGGGMMNFPPGTPAAEASPRWGFYFTVEDIQAAAKRIDELGGKMVQEPMPVPGGAWTLKAIDDQGAPFALTAAR